ncbi:MAG: UPF0182 family protein, partial [Deltaproteobacteria bacterium]|nr:UPF0182 family protein [Deltaproteobacteria bacterium]
MKKFIGLIFLGIFVLVLFLGQTITLYTDLLWFREVEFAHVFTKMLFIKVLLGLVFGGLFFLILYINIKLAARLQSEVPIPETPTEVNLPSPELIDPLLAEHGGRVANTAGDSLLLEFSSVVDAVRCAI